MNLSILIALAILIAKAKHQIADYREEQQTKDLQEKEQLDLNPTKLETNITITSEHVLLPGSAIAPILLLSTLVIIVLMLILTVINPLTPGVISIIVNSLIIYGLLQLANRHLVFVVPARSTVKSKYKVKLINLSWLIR